MSFKQKLMLGAQLVPVEIEAKWHSFGEGRWEFMCFVSANGKTYDSIRYSPVTTNDISEALAYLDEPEWPSKTLPEVLIGTVSYADLKAIADMLTFSATKSFPEIDPDEAYFGH